ncbi:MAG: hypothetical protein AB7U98_08750 [Candidatus Nitrosocosmicus sp.]|jgi:hypothetical protein
MDVSFFSGLNPLDQTIIGTFFAWSITAIGASAVFFTRSINRKFFDALLGFAAGIMSEIFPQEREFYESCADDADLSRFSGGIHLIQDWKEGLKFGKMIGNKVVEDMRVAPHTFIFDDNQTSFNKMVT